MGTQLETKESIYDWVESKIYIINPTHYTLHEIVGGVELRNVTRHRKSICREELQEIVDNVHSRFHNNIEKLDDAQTVHIVGTKPILQSIQREFLLSSILWNFTERGLVEWHKIDDYHQKNVILADEIAGVFLDLQGTPFALGSENEALRKEMKKSITQNIKQSDNMDMDKIPLSEVRRNFRENISPEFFQTFLYIISHMEEWYKWDAVPAPPKFADRQHIYASLVLSSAIHSCNFHNIKQKAAENMIAGQSSLSRMKTRLEDKKYIIDTPLISGDGRPPSKLLLTSKSQDYSTIELAEKVYDAFIYPPSTHTS